LWLASAEPLPPDSLTLPPPEFMLALDWLAMNCWPVAAQTVACVPDGHYRTEIARRVPEIARIFTALEPLPLELDAEFMALFLPNEAHLRDATISTPAGHRLWIVAAGALFRFLPPLTGAGSRDHAPLPCVACIDHLRGAGWKVHETLHLHGERAVFWSRLSRVYRRIGRDDLAACAMIRSREQYRGLLTGTLTLITAGGDT
jgi:hypothetical protein